MIMLRRELLRWTSPQPSLQQIPKSNPMIGKTITIVDYKGKEVTGKVLGIDPRPCTGVISNNSLIGEHFIIAGPSGGYSDRTYALTSNPYKVHEINNPSSGNT